MTSEEKSKKLVEMFMPFCFRVNTGGAIQVESAKQCALIAVDEILQENEANHTMDAYNYDQTKNYEYWQQVKKEVNKL